MSTQGESAFSAPPSVSMGRRCGFHLLNSPHMALRTLSTERRIEIQLQMVAENFGSGVGQTGLESWLCPSPVSVESSVKWGLSQ